MRERCRRRGRALDEFVDAPSGSRRVGEQDPPGVLVHVLHALERSVVADDTKDRVRAHRPTICRIALRSQGTNVPTDNAASATGASRADDKPRGAGGALTHRINHQAWCCRALPYCVRRAWITRVPRPCVPVPRPCLRRGDLALARHAAARSLVGGGQVRAGSGHGEHGLWGTPASLGGVPPQAHAGVAWRPAALTLIVSVLNTLTALSSGG